MQPKQAPPDIPGPEQVTLRDGTLVTIRPVHSEDAPLLKAGFARLSPESVYLRFLSEKKMLTDAEAHLFADVDYMERMAFVATRQEAGEEVAIGVARYACLAPDHPNDAEAAVVVNDEYQRRGLGTLLLTRLVDYARTHGVRYLRATVLMENNRILSLIQRGGLPFKKRYEDGVWEITVDLGG